MCLYLRALDFARSRLGSAYHCAFMVAERVGRPVLDIPSPHRPGERAAAKDLIPPGTSSEDSDETPRWGSRIGAEEEEQGGVTPISRSSAATGPDHEGSALSPTSGADGFSSVATDPHDDSRPITKRELTRFRRVVVKTFQTMNPDLMSLLNAEIADQNRQREELKDLLASRVSTLNSLMDTHVEEVLKQSAPAAIEPFWNPALNP